MYLTKKQEAIRKKLEKDTGFGNGHVFYMVAGITESETGELLDYLDNKIRDDGYCFCGLTVEETKGGITVCFDSHEKCISEVQDEISVMCPEAVVYWNDCWDYEGTMCIQKRGLETPAKDVCIVKLDCDNETDDENYFETLATVTDIKTGTSFEIGGGYIYTDERASIMSLVSETSCRKKTA